jgi:hypothetical protein
MGITFVDIAHFCSGLYSLILILIGTPLNLLCFYIFTRLVSNRSNPTIIVFSYLALIELLIPFTWNLNYVVRELLWKYRKNITLKNLEEHSLFVCKLISYSAYFSLECAAWLKTLATFARCVSLHHQWSLKKWLSKPIIIRRISWIIIFLIALINSPIWIINGEYGLDINKFNETKRKVKCYQSKFFVYWEIVHLLLYNFIPFTLMISCNILIIHQVRESRKRTQKAKITSSIPSNRSAKSNSGGRLTLTLILVTIFFIIFTSPSAIFYILFGKKIKRHKALITMNLSNLATTSHVTSFIIYCLTSTDFRNAAINVLLCRPTDTPPHPLPTVEEKQQHHKLISNQSSIVQSNDDENQRKLPLLQS